MKIIIISKDNYWTSRLIEKLKTYKLDFIYLNKYLSSDIKKYNPDWIFFFHWSDMVEKIYTPIINAPLLIPEFYQSTEAEAHFKTR